jgi:catechol 2,3-dioxygenase-like lactoylglutathione lyase family enzyme
MLRGLSTVSFFADDVTAARAWYTELLGSEPYFVRPIDGPPAYVEFRIGDYQHELGIVDRRFAPSGRPDRAGGAVTYWHVDDVRASFDRLLSMGATIPYVRSRSSADPGSSPHPWSIRSGTSSASCTTSTTWTFSRCVVRTPAGRVRSGW